MTNFSENKITARQHDAMECTNPTGDLDSVRRYRLEGMHEQLGKHDYADMLLFDRINCRYPSAVTGMQVWCSHCETRGAFAAADGPLILFEHGDCPHLVEDLPTIDEYRVHSSFYDFAAGGRSSEKAEQFADTIVDLVATYGGGNQRLARDRLSHFRGFGKAQCVS